LKKKHVFWFLLIAVLLFSGWHLYQYLMRSRLPDIRMDRSHGDRLLVNGRRYLVKGFCYNPIPVGKDYEYNFWGDPSKPWLIDGKLMKAAGANTVRFYRAGKNSDEVKRVLNDLYFKFGIRSMIGDYLGFWDWPPPNYADETFCSKTRTRVVEMVRLYKDSPGVLFWVLGNENNYSFDRNIQAWSTDAIDAIADPAQRNKEKAKIYYSFINDLAREIKLIDKVHPVVLGVGETKSLDVASRQCPDIDLIGMISYRGPGFGNLFREVKLKFDKPVVLIEWGCDGYNAQTHEPDEVAQSDFISLQWKDILRNTDPEKGVGNCVGGTIFEWSDEWWKGNENLPYTWSVHDTSAYWYSSSYHYDAYGPEKMNMNEEWWGVTALNPKKIKGVNQRTPKEAYGTIKSLWAEKA